jgi:hypothetical protein
MEGGINKVNFRFDQGIVLYNDFSGRELKICGSSHQIGIWDREEKILNSSYLPDSLPTPIFLPTPETVSLKVKVLRAR